LTTITDAINTVLLHSESARWLLNRKKITRKVLFEYLNLHKVTVSGQSEKIILVDCVLEFWESNKKTLSKLKLLPDSVGNYSQSHSGHHVPIVESVESAGIDMGIAFSQWWFGDILLGLSSIQPPAKNGKLADQFFSDG